MQLWERLGGALFTALAMASLMAQAEAAPAPRSMGELAALVDPACVTLTNDLFAVGYPEMLFVEHLLQQPADEQPAAGR